MLDTTNCQTKIKHQRHLKIRLSEFKNYLQLQIGKDPLINIQASGGVLENISKALRDMDPDGGSVAIPEGAQIKGTDGEVVTGSINFTILLMQKDNYKTFSMRVQATCPEYKKENATKLINEINNTIKNVKNADPNFRYLHLIV